MEERGSHPHHLEPLQNVVVRVHVEWHSHQVRTELRNCPDDGETLQLSGGVGLLGLVERPRRTTDDAFLAFPDLCQYCADACSRRVRIQSEGLAKVGEGSNRAGGEECSEAVKSVLSVGAPMKDRILPGQCMQWVGDSRKILNITPVIPGKTQEGADFSGGFRRWNLPNGHKERWIRHEALLCYPVPQVTDLLGGESTFFGAEFQLVVSQPLEDLVKTGQVFLPCGGEHDDVIEVEEARFPMETREDAVHEEGEGGGGVAEAKWNLIKFVQLAAASTKRRFLLVLLHDRDLPVSTLKIQSGKPASPV